jgi:hypothetical protein
MAMDKPWFTAWVDDDGTGLTGTIWNKAEINKLIDGLDGARHAASVSCLTPQAVATGWVMPNLANIEFYEGVLPAAASHLQVGPSEGGLYLVTAEVTWDPAHTTGVRAAQITNDAGLIALQGANQANIAGFAGTGITLCRLIHAAAGTNFKLFVYTDVATNVLPPSRFAAVRL